MGGAVTVENANDSDMLSLASNKRATHYWDEQGKLPRLFQKTLGLAPRPAWDVYLIYPPGVKGEAEPPKPIYWQHQLGGVTSAPCLDVLPDHIQEFPASLLTLHP